jgi:hypothetical protein
VKPAMELDPWRNHFVNRHPDTPGAQPVGCALGFELVQMD